MQAPIIAAMITASGALFSKLIERGGSKAPPDLDGEAKAGQIASDFYSPLRESITNNCFKILLFLERGENETPRTILKYVRPQTDSATEDQFLEEFNYSICVP